MGKTRTDLVLRSARQLADDGLLDRTLFTVEPKADFLLRPDAPPRPSACAAA